MGRRLRRSSTRRFRVCSLGRSSSAPVLCPRSLRRQAVLLRMRGPLADIQQHAELAANALHLLANDRAKFDLRAYTVVYDRLIADQERYYAGLVAEALRIPIHYLVADSYDLYERWDDAKVRKPEPDSNPLTATLFDQVEQVGLHSRVALYGEGPDNLLFYEWKPYVADLICNLHFKRLATDVWSYISSQRRMPLLRGIPVRLRRLL